MIKEYKAVRNQYIINEEREGYAHELLSSDSYTRLSNDVVRDIERMSIVEVIS